MPRVLVLVVLCALIGAACSPTTSTSSPGTSPTGSGTASAEPSDSGPKAVTVLVGGWGNGLFDPAQADDESLILQRLFQGWLIEADSSRNTLLSGIATEWDTSADGKTWTYTIAPNITAQNGEAITADDVAFTWDLIYGDTGKARVASGEKFASTLIGFQDLVASVEKVGADQVALTFNDPDYLTGAFRLSQNQPELTGVILPKDYWEQVGPGGYQANPIGIGPFKVTSYKADQEVVFERFDDYYYQPANGYPEDRRPIIDQLTVKLVRDPATRLAALQAGQADVIASDISQLGSLTDSGATVIWAQEAAYLGYNFNQCWMPELWCYKTEVRQALEYALDTASIAEELYGGVGAEAKGWGYITPSAFGYTPEIDPRPFDLSKAKTMLADAGFPDGSGIPAFKIYTYSDAPIPFLPEVAQIMADSWSQLGLSVSVQVGDTTSIKDFVRAWETGSGDPGSILLNSNDSRWFALIPTVEDYGIPPIWKGRLCGEPQPDCIAIDAMLDALPTNQGLDAVKQPYIDANVAMYNAAMRAHVVTINKPWAVGADIQWQPWPLSLDLTGIWSLDKG